MPRPALEVILHVTFCQSVGPVGILGVPVPLILPLNLLRNVNSLLLLLLLWGTNFMACQGASCCLIVPPKRSAGATGEGCFAQMGCARPATAAPLAALPAPLATPCTLDLVTLHAPHPPPTLPTPHPAGQTFAAKFPFFPTALAAGKYRRYSYSSLRDLLRVIRNKHNHFRELPPELQRKVGPLPEGFLDYFTTR
jgi:hypothetical protein